MKLLMIALIGSLGLFAHARPKDKIYSVYEVDVLSAASNVGERFRVVEIGPLIQEAIADEIHFDDEAWAPRDDGLGNVPLLPEEKTKLKPGEPVVKEMFHWPVRSLFPHPELRLQPLKGQKMVKVEIRLVKACIGKFETVSRSNIQKKQVGMWALPTMKTRDVTVIDRPTCFAASDKVFNLGAIPAPSKEIQAAQSAAGEEVALKETEDRRFERIRAWKKIVNEKVASRLKSRPFSIQPSSAFANEVRKSLCPQTAALMTALGIDKIKIEKKEREREVQKGSTSVSYNTITTVLLKDGRVLAMPDWPIYTPMREITPDIFECMTILPAEISEASPKAQQASVDFIKMVVDRVFEDEAAMVVDAEKNAQPTAAILDLGKKKEPGLQAPTSITTSKPKK